MKIPTIYSADQLIKRNLLVRHLGGSHAYGTSLPTSDVDYRGIFCGEPVNILTPFFPIREAEVMDEEDTKYYELAHFMKLCLDCNPNIIETLWVDDNDIKYRTAAYELLRKHRSELLSTKVAFTFSGYALAQLKRIKGHNKWINQPQAEQKPLPYWFLTMVQWFGDNKNLNPDFAVYQDDHRLVPYGNDTFGVVKAPGYQVWDDTGQLNTQFDGERSELPKPLMIVRWLKDEYRVACEKHEQYWTWKKNRNASRGVLEEQFGYDTKHAMHLVRLLRMGEEILSTGQVHVKRPDAVELLQIRDGAWAYKDLVEYATNKDETIRGPLYSNSVLPKKPDRKFAAALLMNVQDAVWETNKVNDHE